MKRSKSSRILKILSYVLLITGMIVILYPFYLTTALVGVRSIEHADENCKTFDWKLTEEEMKILDSKIEECAL